MEIIFKDFEGFIINEIQKARTCIKLSIPKGTSIDILNSLISAKKRGVSVELVVESHAIKEDIIIFQNTAAKITEALNEIYDLGSVIIYNENKDRSYEKFCLIDDKILLFGSYNWSNSWIDKNDGSIVVVRSSVEDEIIHTYLNLFIELKSNARYYYRREDINVITSKYTSNKLSIYEYEETKSENYSIPSLIPFKDKNGKWGFYSSENREIIVEPIYSNAYPFCDGLACVQKFINGSSFSQQSHDINAFHAFINETGKLITDFNFHFPYHPFSFDWASIKAKDRGNRYGSIDYSGNEILPFNYGYLGVLSEGKVVYGSSRDVGSYFDDVGYEITRYGIISADGNLIMPPRYEYIRPYSEGMAAVGITYYEPLDDYTYGYIDKYGNLVTETQYFIAERFSNGWAKVKDDNTNFINKSGYKLFDDNYLIDAESFKNGLSFIKAKDGFSGLINTLGKKVMNAKISKSFRIVSNFYNKIAIYTNESGRYGFIDIDNNIITECIYRYAENHKYGAALVYGDGFQAYINTDGKTIFKTSGKRLEPFANNLGMLTERGEVITYITHDGSTFDNNSN